MIEWWKYFLIVLLAMVINALIAMLGIKAMTSAKTLLAKTVVCIVTASFFYSSFQVLTYFAITHS